MIKKQLTPENALNRIADLCARSEQCTHEVVEKLKKWGISPTDSARIIKTLKENRYIDDSRYANAYATDKLRFSGWGRRKIAIMLRNKRIPATYIQNALNLIDDNEYLNKATDVLKSHCRNTDILQNRDEIIKLIRFGMQRGFEYDTIIKAIKSLQKEAEISRIS